MLYRTKLLAARGIWPASEIISSEVLKSASVLNEAKVLSPE